MAEPLSNDEVMALVGQCRPFWMNVVKKGPTYGPLDTPEVKALHMNHLRYQYTLRQQGKMVLFGPVFEAPADIVGIGVYTVATLAEAEELAFSDPAVKAGRLVAEVKQWFTLPGDSLPE